MTTLVCSLLPLPLALLLSPLAARVAFAVGLVDRPRADRFGSRTTPKLGGLVIAVALLPLLVVVRGSEAGAVLPAGLVGFALAFTTGLLDDARDLSPRAKLLGQVLAAAAAVAWVVLRTEPAGLLAHAPLPIVAMVATVWIIGFQNAVNFLDNMDGIVAGVVALGLLALSVTLGSGAATLALAVAAATIGFLPWNVASPARLYLGDAGALPLGHAMGFLAFVAVWDSTTLSGAAGALIVVLIPILDITFVTITRLRAGVSPATGGRDHTTHRIFARVGTVSRTRRIFWGLALLLAGLSVASRGLGGGVPVLVLGVLVASGLAAGIWLATCPTPDAAPPGD